MRHARAWMENYITAERRGPESLRRFLLDLDAKDKSDLEARTIGEVLERYLEVNAHPRNEGGLAPSTFERYEQIVGRHMLDKPRPRGKGGLVAPTAWGLALAPVPAVRFNGPKAPSAWREQMLREGVPKPTRGQAWRVLSAALSWAAASDLVLEIEINGCRLATEPRGNKRRSLRAGGTGYAPHGRRTPGWALSPQAVEAIRAEILQPAIRREEILAHRDAIVVSLQYGLCARNQEVWGLRWASLIGEFAWVLEVLSCGRLDTWGKTERSTQRRTAMPGILREDLAAWRAALRDARAAGPRVRLHHPRRSHQLPARRARQANRSLPLQREPGPLVGRTLLQPSCQEGSTAPRARLDPRCDALRPTPWRDIPATTR